jgi:hypothetical protein
MESDAVALDYAQAYVASRQETSIRCDAIVLDLYTDNYNTGIIAALDLDFLIQLQCLLLSLVDLP